MPETVLNAAYLAAAVLFILSLNGLSTQETARRGNLFGMLGMGLAVLATAFHPRLSGYVEFGVVLIAGASVGAFLAARVAMTAMPQLVAMLHSFVGLAAVLVGVSTSLAPVETVGHAAEIVHRVEIWLGVAVGAVTFTGSVIAWAKLDGKLGGKPLLLPGRHVLNALIALALLALAVPYLGATEGGGIIFLLINVGISAVLTLVQLEPRFAAGRLGKGQKCVEGIAQEFDRLGRHGDYTRTCNYWKAASPYRGD